MATPIDPNWYCVDQQFFENQGPFTLAHLATVSGATLTGPLPKGMMPETLIYDVAALGNANVHQASVLHNAKYKQAFQATHAGACFVTPEDAVSAPETVACLVSEMPYRSYAQAAAAFYPETDPVISPTSAVDGAFIDPSAKISANCTIEVGAVIGPEAEIGEGTRIGAHAVIGRRVRLGKGCVVGRHVSISHALIGNKVSIKPGARIGQHGFGFHMDQKGHLHVPQLGRAIIEDAAEIGANVTIDRGAGPDTVIGQGARIDNLVQIAHNVRIGKGCVIVAQVGISGSTEIGDYSVIAGQAGLTGHLKIGKGVKIGAQSGVMRNVADGATVAGSPAVPVMSWHRQTVTLARLASERKKTA